MSQALARQLTWLCRVVVYWERWAMVDGAENLGTRIVAAARLALVMHFESIALAQTSERRVVIGGAGSDLVTDDTPLATPGRTMSLDDSAQGGAA